MRLSGSTREVIAAANSAIGTLTNRTHCQPRYSVSTPPSSTPTAPPEPATAPQTPSARLRSAPSAKVVVRMDSAAGERIAAPRPWSARAAISWPSFCDSPPSSEARAKRMRPAVNTRRRPSRSAMRPPSSRKPPKTRVYALTTQDRFSWEKWRSRPMDGSATLTIEASSMTTNCAAASRTSARPFLDTGSDWLTGGTPSDWLAAKWKRNSVYAFSRYGIEVPVVNPYSCERVDRHTGHCPSAAGRRAPQSRAHPQGGPRRLRRQGPRRAPRRRGAPREGRRGHGLPPLPHEGRAARGARARAVRHADGVGARGRGGAGPVGRVPRDDLARGRAPGLRPRADGGRRRLQAERRAPGRGAARQHRAADGPGSGPGRDARRCHGRGRAADDVRPRQRDADERRRLAPLSDRHARRPARLGPLAGSAPGANRPRPG